MELTKHSSGYRVEGTISIVWREGVEEERRIPVMAIEKFEQPTMTVGMDVGLTKNMGDFNSIKFHVSLACPCYVGEQDETYQFVKEWVEERVEEMNEEIQEANQPAKGG